MRIERARQTLVQRLARQLGTRVEVQLLGAERLGGQLAAIGKDWLMLRHGGSEELIPFGALAWWAGREAGRERSAGRATGRILPGACACSCATGHG